MDNRPRPGLDHQQMRERLRVSRDGSYTPRQVGHYRGRVSDTLPAVAKSEPNQQPLPVDSPKPTSPRIKAKTQPHLPRQSRSEVLKRHMVKASAKKFRPPKRRRSLKPLATALSVVIVFSSLAMGYSLLQYHYDFSLGTPKVLSKSQVDDGIIDSLPSEDSPGDLSDYKVPDAYPRLISIRKLQVNARVQAISVSSNNILKMPSNVFDVGWYNGSAKPGEKGTLVVNGYVSGPTKRGAFFSLSSLIKDDKIEIQSGDGKSFSYTVQTLEVVDSDKVDMAKIVTTSVPGKNGLNLMTTGGRFNIGTNTFEKRVIVFAVQDN